MSEEKEKGLSGSTLKLIAVVSMLIDHMGAAVVGRLYYASAYGGVMLSDGILEFYRSGRMLTLYNVMRGIGRVAFPIYCFLLVEGFLKTRNELKYAARLALFALISEIPFDLAFHSSIWNPENQNVFFTLLLGLLAMIAMDVIGKRVWAGNVKVNWIIIGILSVISVVIFAEMADLLKTDYHSIGVLCIVALYLFRKQKLLQALVGCVAFWWELPAPAAFIPILFYNGKRGWNLKYFFYAFYPIHLLILYAVCLLLGIHVYQAP